MIQSTFFGPDVTFHHVGLAVKSIRNVSPESDVIINDTQGVLMSFVHFHDLTVELLEPLGDDSPITRDLREGTKLLHLCFEVPDVAEAIRLGRSAGFHRISRPVCVPEFGDRKIAWVYSKQYGLVELVERVAM